ncbi:hypothetical protein KC19_5G129200 [Ceratodon purpureus]|uniref:BHLH domain-containing protein n=1 Tax=Ceratodon purpureus TaxID=3225 RepID=A0A8T0I299_CERPU|nr:hypothetical protein KC19_5G129200 [Ceratodon purpureus]
MMGDMHRGLVSLEAPLCDDNGVHGFNSFGLYQQIPSVGIPCLGIPSMSWSATDPALLSLEAQSSGKAPISWQAESCVQQSLQYNAGYSSVGSQMEMMAALNADSYSPSVNELSQMVQLYSSLYQDQYGYSNISPFDTASFRAEQLPLIPGSSEVLQVVSSSGSHDSLSTTETWRSEASGGCAPNYENLLANLNDSASVTLARDSHDSSNLQPQRHRLDQGVALLPTQDSWIHTQPQADTGRNNLPTALALIQDSPASRPSYDVLPVRSPSDPPAFKRPRTWDEALQQGSAENDHLRYSLASKTSLKLECSLGPLSRTLPARTSTRQTPFQGRLSAIHSTGAGSSGYSARLLDLQDEGRFINGKPAATSVEPQSVAARHRRKKISERMRVLEKLIPGGNKMDTATMLDEAIEYVKFLQLQVQILESDSLDDIPSAVSTQRGQGNITGLKRKMDSSAVGGDLSAALSLMRAPASSPLVLSEVLQQQLFKQKLCLVSIRQCPPRTQSTTQAIAPSILRKK